MKRIWVIEYRRKNIPNDTWDIHASETPHTNEQWAIDRVTELGEMHNCEYRTVPYVREEK